MTVEEFITRLIRHIPDEQFKTIRHYGVYSRRIKKLSRALVTAWQKTARKWVAKAKQVLKRKNWRERIIEGTGKDPMVCPTSRAVMERMINDLTGIQKTKTCKEKEKTATQPKQASAVQGDGQLYLFAV